MRRSKSPVLRTAIHASAIVWACVALPCQGAAQPAPYPLPFQTRDMVTSGATLHVRVGGSGPAVVLLHGFGDTGDMWTPLALQLVRHHTVVVPDLRGMGLSSRPPTGYDKRSEAADIAALLDSLGIRSADFVTHDIGNMVGFAFASRYPDRIERLVLMDAPIPGVGAWEQLKCSPATWHFTFQGPDEERLVAGRERIFLDRFYNEFAADPRRIDEATRVHYASLYAQPGAMHAALSQFAAFAQDARDNAAALRAIPGGKLATPVLAIGGAKSYGPTMAAVARDAFITVKEQVIPDAGHWLMEEQPAAVIAAVVPFLTRGDAATPDDLESAPPEAIRLTRAEVLARRASLGTRPPGSSNADGVEEIVLRGDPGKPGLYTILLRVPPNSRIAAHSHPDDRMATVIAGDWYFGYGSAFDTQQLKRLTSGSVYAEPARGAHFAMTKDHEATVEITGYGPSGVTYVQGAEVLRRR